MLRDYSVTHNHHICSHSVQRFAIQNSTTLELRLSTASQETFEQVTAGTRWHNKWPRSSRDEHNSPAPSLLPILATKPLRRARWVGGGRAAVTQPALDGSATRVILPGWRSACAAHYVIAEGLECGAGGGIGQAGDLRAGGRGPAAQV